MTGSLAVQPFTILLGTGTAADGGASPLASYASATAVPELARDLLHRHFIDGYGG